MNQLENNEEMQKFVDERIKSVISFTSRKLTDTPTDDLMTVNRKYVNLNGTVASRPSSVAAKVGQGYFATDTSIPMKFNGTNWVNGVGSVVATG